MRRTDKNYTTKQAIELHAEANKSDPFASRRLALVLNKGHDKASAVGTEAQRTIAGRKADIRRDGGELFATVHPLTLAAFRKRCDERHRQVNKPARRTRQKMAA